MPPLGLAVDPWSQIAQRERPPDVHQPFTAALAPVQLHLAVPGGGDNGIVTTTGRRPIVMLADQLQPLRQVALAKLGQAQSAARL